MKNLILATLIGFVTISSTAKASQFAFFSHTCSRAEAATAGVKEIDCTSFDFVTLDQTGTGKTIKSVFSSDLETDNKAHYVVNAILMGLNDQHDAQLLKIIQSSTSVPDALQKLAPLKELACSEGKSKVSYARYSQVMIPVLGCQP